MKKLVFTISFLSLAFFGSSQSTKGITGKPDTSYSVHSAYASTIKTHPGAKIVNEIRSPSIIEERNIVYCVTANRKFLLDAFYSKHKATSKKVAVIIIHGGGWRTGNRTLHYPMAQRLADMGYTCFTP